MCTLHSFLWFLHEKTPRNWAASQAELRRCNTHLTHTNVLYILLLVGGGRAGCRLDHGAWVGVEEWVGRYAPCFRARGVQRIRCCNRIRKLACERASRWKTALRSSAKLEQAAASSPIVAVQILSNSWINRKPLCVLFYCDCKKFPSNCCRSGQWLILRPCECVWSSWESEAVFVWQVGPELSPVCVNTTFTQSRKLPCGVKDDMVADLLNTLQETFSSFVQKMSVWSEKWHFWKWKCFFLCYVLLKMSEK